VENVGVIDLIDLGYWRSKRVLVTGHSGFKGWWLSQWLTLLGAQVYGLSNAPSSEYLDRPFLLEDDVFKKILITDLLETLKIEEFVLDIIPDVVFHLAAQPSVIQGYRSPSETLETNFFGTANLLTILRKNVPTANVIVITTDKVYKNESSGIPFIESDELAINGDPYSSSKAFADLFSSNFKPSNIKKDLYGKILIARAGNVIGGGGLVPGSVDSRLCQGSLFKPNPYTQVTSFN
jgi:CDP-glucose 4,6-dehydratase